ncbi:MAG: hypothetical protein ACLPKE_26900 [Streptosporangiaceae bacterium]
MSPLRKIGWDDLAARAEALGGSPKGAALLDQPRRFAGEKVLRLTVPPLPAEPPQSMVSTTCGCRLREPMEVVRIPAVD